VDQGDELHRYEHLSVQVARVKEKTRPWKEIIAAVLAIGAAYVAHHVVTIFAPPPNLTDVIRYGFAIAFCVLATSAVLGISAKTRAVFEPRLGSAHSAVIRYTVLLVGLIIVLFTTLQLFGIQVGQLLAAGAVTSVLVGIAAQQSLSNIFAGMVLLLSRPFRVGDAIRLRAGALGGQLDGVVTEIGITYIRLDTGDSVMSVPNSQVLAAAVGPVPRKPEEPKPPVTTETKPPAISDPENRATRAPGAGTSIPAP
jgi:small-conductance mechanosensitive channel